ncbi:hypothetical protein C0Q70_20461 [Pomacea canaliculata]|uniref:Phosphomevalonate kinase n=1 Tax=Pomacea canaliculata TaxID=400727 RepID=A0A2T7NFK5_POMCA|nr:phosphomevalonate kinase-like [Pomacea canaliculata]PVD19967.1 hypothetical protein C0Q70_20461 [Pomacea canaliculata]
MTAPAAVIVLSGKRKSGKDYVASVVQNRLGADMCCIFRLSGPLKYQYAKEHNLDFDRLLDASEYKEKYRMDMIRWGEERRTEDPSFFCRLATQGEGSDRPVWIVSDARRLSDLQYFHSNFRKQVITVRVTADEDVRKARGYVFTKGVDDVESECGLDIGVEWDVVITNNNEARKFEEQITYLVNQVQARLRN